MKFSADFLIKEKNEWVLVKQFLIRYLRKESLAKTPAFCRLNLIIFPPSVYILRDLSLGNKHSVTVNYTIPPQLDIMENALIKNSKNNLLTDFEYVYIYLFQEFLGSRFGSVDCRRSAGTICAQYELSADN